MNNFGVIEVAGTRTTHAPGWAYVPDLASNHPLSASGASTPMMMAASGTGATGAAAPPRKRARNAGAGATLSFADLTARQEAKARRELEVLDRDNARDVVIPIPSKPSGASSSSSAAAAANTPAPPKPTRASMSAAAASASAAAGGGGGRYTPNVRRILQSQKTFANHLDDYLALGGPDGAAADAALSASVATGGSSRSAAAAATAAITRTRTGGTATPAQQQAQKKAATDASAAKKQQGAEGDEDVEMTDAASAAADPTAGDEPRSTILRSYTGLTPPALSGDEDPVLASRVPPLPSDAELRALLAAPPLSYLEARAGAAASSAPSPYPTRVFCEVCGYWGRVRCMKCGTRVCALECLETHREECVTRYGL